ncbi:Hypothetical predicted protein [Xyrichtys novacula]|uniref:Uncharacterized protein n=1 Tax=Xyrichtys novacula TaxID=13765 RepID=A0AAV1FIX5_XYRNO|nr:Hypothetical predicted protein [Xyrichtys novacula]
MSPTGDHHSTSAPMVGCPPSRAGCFRRVSMAFERHRSAAASLTLRCPGLSAPGLSDTGGQYRLPSGLRMASEPIMNRTCHRGTEPRPYTTHSQQTPPSLLLGLWRNHQGPRSVARLTSDLPPCLDTSKHKAKPEAAD